MNKTRSSGEIVARNLKLALAMIDAGNDDMAYELIMKTAEVLRYELVNMTNKPGSEINKIIKESEGE